MTALDVLLYSVAGCLVTITVLSVGFALWMLYMNWRDER